MASIGKAATATASSTTPMTPASSAASTGATSGATAAAAAGVTPSRSHHKRSTSKAENNINNNNDASTAPVSGGNTTTTSTSTTTPSTSTISPTRTSTTTSSSTPTKSSNDNKKSIVEMDPPAPAPPAHWGVAPRHLQRRMVQLSPWQQCKYQWLGPTTMHLQHEFYLLVSLLLLTVSTLQSNNSNHHHDDDYHYDPFAAYRFSNNNSNSFLLDTILRFIMTVLSPAASLFVTGDWIFLILVTAWLARHVLVRWLCVWDPSTLRNPSLTGLASRFFTAHVFGGQTFDRPALSVIHPKVLSNKPLLGGPGGSGSGTSNTSGNTGSNSGSNTATSGGAGTAAALLGSSGLAPGASSLVVEEGAFTWYNLVPCSFLYLWQWIRVRLWFPLLDMVQPARRPALSKRFWIRMSHQQQQQQRYEWQQQQWQKAQFQQQQQHLQQQQQQQHSHRSHRSNRGRGGGGGGGGGGDAATAGNASAVRSTLTFVVSTIRSLLRAMFQLLHFLYHWWLTSLAPTLQFMLPTISITYIVWNVIRVVQWNQPLFDNGPIATSSALSIAAGTSTAVKEEEMESEAAGVYQNLRIPTLYEMVCVISAFGTITSLLFYHRLTYPLADQVASAGSALKDMRLENKRHGGGGGFFFLSSSSMGSSSSSSSSSPPISGALAVVAAATSFVGGLVSSWWTPGPAGCPNPTADVPWTERNRSIVTENRFGLYLVLTLLRCMEHVIVCGILPRTAFVCRYTGHCRPGTPVWELARILYAPGTSSSTLSSKVVKGGNSSLWARLTAVFQNNVVLLWSSLFRPEKLAAAWMILNIVVITCVILLSQAVLLNKTYLAVVGYIAGEWALVDDQELREILIAHSNNNNNNNTTTTVTLASIGATVWDPRRRYKKSDIVIYEKNLYRATTNAPEGRPQELHPWQRTVYNAFSNELGHAATSRLLAQAAQVQLLFTLCHVVLWMLCLLTGWATSIPAFLTSTAANLLAAHAILNIGMTDYQALEQLNAEISQ